MRFLVAALVFLSLCSSAYAERATFTYLRTVPTSELNDMLDAKRAEFIRGTNAGKGYRLPPSSTASNDVDLYIVQYETRNPRAGWIKASGLLAIPKLANLASVPMISYQHGTVWGTYEVPSYSFKATNPAGYDHYEAAYETRYMVGLYGGNGYVVMAADLVGMGDGPRSRESYMIKSVNAQANYDLYLDVRKFLAARQVGVSKFFLGGWSAGGLNTPGFLALLEARGVKVDGAFTAASPNDPFVALNAVFYHPRELDAFWINTTIALTIFSCERHMGPKGLAKATIDPTYYAGFKSIYDRTGYPAGLLGENGLLAQWGKKPFLDYLRPAFRNPSYFANSDYGKCLAANATYRQEFKAPMRMYYGANDEVIRQEVGRLAYDYQEAMVDNTPDAPSSNTITPILVPGGDHRLTFISAAAAAKPWLDNLP